MNRVAIINSRQTKTPAGDDPWICATLAAVDHAVSTNGWEIVSSIRMITWDLVTWRTGMTGGTIQLVIPLADESEEDKTKESILTEYGLDAARTSWQFFSVPASDLAKKSWWPERDQRVIELADVIFPVSLRPNGLLEQLMGQRDSRADSRFTTAYKPQPRHAKELVDPNRLNPELAHWPGDYLIHWTRASNGPWPGEKTASFLEDLVQSREHYCRSAFATLQRILREGVIRASSWRIADDRSVVSFTELSPLDSLSLMRWRARWARWSFEPYGIAVHRDWAMSRDVQPVRYVSEQEWKALSPEERPFCHRIGVKAGEWPAEREWRCLSDFSLRDAPDDAVRIIVRDCKESEKMKAISESLVLGFLQ